MKKKLGVFSSLFGIATVVVACSSDGGSNLEGPNAPGSGGASYASEAGTVELHEGTTIVEQDLADVADVRTDRIVFPDSTFDRLSSRRAGDILISDRQAPGTSGKNPAGFLRKVVSIARSDEGVVVMTSDASLPEAVNELTLHTRLQTPKFGIDGPVHPTSTTIHPLAGGSTTVRALDFSGKKLFERQVVGKAADGTEIPYTIHETVDTGTLDFAPSYDVNAKVGFLKLESFSLTGAGPFEADLAMSAGLKLDPAAASKELENKPITYSHSEALADYDVQIDSIKIGRLSIPATVHFHATLDCELSFTAPAEVKVHGHASGNVTAAVSYADKKLSSSSNHTITAKVDSPEYTTKGFARAYCTVNPTFQIEFFRQQTVTLTANAYEGAGGSLSCGGKNASGTNMLVSGDVEAGVSVKAAAVLDLFGYHFDKECTLFDINETARYDATYPYPGGPNATCTISGPYPLPPKPEVNPAACFEVASAEPGTNGPGTGDDGDGSSTDPDGGSIIQGTCTHDVCTAGDKLGQQCDDCTMKVCAADSYCCDTFWGLSCFDAVEKYCGKKCN